MNSRQIMVVALAGIMSISSLMASEQEERRDNRRERDKKQQDGNNKQPTAKQKRRMLHYLNANYPTQMKAIRELMRTDPAAAKEKIKVLAQQSLAKFEAERKAIFALVKKYRETKDEAILDEIREKIAVNYDKRIEYAEKVVDRLDKGLDKAKDKLKELKSKREKNIDKILNKVKSGKGNAPSRKKKHAPDF